MADGAQSNSGSAENASIELEPTKEETMPTFPMECGQVLTLRPSSNPFAVKHFRSEARRLRLIYASSPTALKMRELDEFSEQIFLYLAGWCVEDDPPPEAIEEVEQFFGGAKSERVMRAKWVRHILISNKEEAVNFIAACLLVTAQLG